MKKQIVLICIGVASLIFGFQNCSEVGFSDANDSGALVATDLDGTDGPDTGEPTGPTTPPTTTPPPPPPPPAAEVPDTPHHYVCVLNGNGKSEKIAYINGKLIIKNATPQDVCMSAEACTDLISQKFDVQGPEKRGFCPGKAGTVELTNAQIKALIGAL